jgi:hypothetical protein
VLLLVSFDVRSLLRCSEHEGVVAVYDEQRMKNRRRRERDPSRSRKERDASQMASSDTLADSAVTKQQSLCLEQGCDAGSTRPSGSGYDLGIGPVYPGTQAAVLLDPGPNINWVLYEASGSCMNWRLRTSRVQAVDTR